MRQRILARLRLGNRKKRNTFKQGILPKQLGLVLGILTNSNKDEIYNTVIGNTKYESIDEEIFILNYYLGLKINQIEFDYNDAQRTG